MSKATRAVDPALLPHARPCWCRECMRAYQRQYNQRTRHVCPVCNIDFLGNTMRKYCSRECVLKARVPRQAGRCANCAVELDTPPKSKRKYCGPECQMAATGRAREQQRAAKAPKPTPRPCGWCLTTYTPLNNGGRYCTNVCGNKARRHWLTWKAPDRSHLGVCIDCYQVHGKAPWLHERCPPCQEARDAIRLGNTTARRNDRYRKGQKIHWTDLVERDGPTCHLCGDPVDTTLRNPHPLSPTVDHLQPIALDGEHEWDNVALAHRHCNTSRGTKKLHKVG